jgi:hypothetical protein
MLTHILPPPGLLCTVNVSVSTATEALQNSRRTKGSRKVNGVLFFVAICHNTRTRTHARTRPFTHVHTDACMHPPFVDWTTLPPTDLQRHLPSSFFVPTPYIYIINIRESNGWSGRQVVPVYVEGVGGSNG